MVKKAVITAAGKGTRQYPATNTIQKEMFPLVDRDGVTKPTLQLVIEEAVNAGIEKIGVIIQPDFEKTLKTHFRKYENHLAFKNKNWAFDESEKLEKLGVKIDYIYQEKQEGFGHAVFSASQWVGDEPFLLMLGDHVHISKTDISCVTQLIQTYNKHQKSTFAVKRTPADQLYLFGTIAGRYIQTDPNVYRISQVVEKPDVQFAREHLAIRELPADCFLTFFGLYIFTPTIFKLLGSNIKNNLRERGEFQLTTAQNQLCKEEGAMAVEMNGLALDMGTPLGYIETMLSLATCGCFKQHIKNLLLNI